MKASTVVLFALPLLASATIVKPKQSGDCKGANIGSISACGCSGTSANYDVLSADVTFQKATARFYYQKDCKGPHVSIASSQCFKPSPGSLIKSVRICGGTCAAC